MISKSVSDQTGKPVKITDPKQVYLIDPDLLESDVGIIAKRDISNVPPKKRRHIYSLLDISAAYNSVRVSPEDQHLLTCIITALRVIKWLRLPFGLKRAGTHFQSAMNKILFKDMILKGIILIYADDILIASQSIEQYMEHLKLLASLLKQNGVKTSVRKSHFFVNNFDFLVF